MREFLKASFTVESDVTSFDVLLFERYSIMLIFTYVTWLGFGFKRMHLVPVGAGPDLKILCRRISLGVIGLSFTTIIRSNV